MALDGQIIAEIGHDLVDLLRELASGSENQRLALIQGEVNTLQDANGKGGGLASTTLSLL